MKALRISSLVLAAVLATLPAFGQGYCYNVVSHYGADPTGVADSYQSIRNAVDDATLIPESEVCIPAGRYRIANTHTGTLFPLDQNIVIRGAGRDVTKIFYDGTPAAVVEVFVVSAGKSATIRDLELEGIPDPLNPIFRATRHAGTSGRFTYESVRMTYVYEGLKTDAGDGMEIAIRNSEFGNIKAQAYLGVQAGTGVTGNIITIENNYFHDIGPLPTIPTERPALYIAMPVRKLVVHNNTFENMGHGLTNNGGTNDESGPIIVSNNRFRNCTGVVLTPYNNDKYRAVISGNDFRDKSYCINLYFGNVTITGNTFRNCVQAITGQSTTNVGGETRHANNVDVVGNFFSGYYGIVLVNSVRHWTVTGNTFDNTTTPGYAPIFMTDGARDLSVTSNTFTLNAQAAVRMKTGADALTFIGNAVKGSSSGVGAVYAEASAANPLSCYLAGNNLGALDANYHLSVPGAVVGWNIFAPGPDGGAAPPALHPAGFVSGTIASAGAITINRAISIYRVTGTTSINTIAIPAGSGWQGPLILVFDSALTVTESGNIDLQGAGSFATTPNDTLTLVYNGTKWYEMTRSVN